MEKNEASIAMFSSKSQDRIVLVKEDYVITDSRSVEKCFSSYFVGVANHDAKLSHLLADVQRVLDSQQQAADRHDRTQLNQPQKRGPDQTNKRETKLRGVCRSRLG